MVVSDTMLGGHGGAVVRHAEWFASRGWEVVVAARADEPDRVDSPYLRPVRFPETARDARSMRRAAADIWNLRRAFQPDVVHCHGGRAFVATRPSGPAYVTLHQIAPVATDPRGYEHVRLAALWVVPRLAVKAFSAYPGAPDGWVFTPHASDRLSSLDVLGPPTAAQPTFLWLARLDEPKRPELFVRAMAELARTRPGARGLMAGSGSLRPDVERLVATTGAPVELLGNRTDVSELLETAWAVVVFSDTEALTFSIQEALWSGRAVVSSPLVGIRWLVGDDRLLAGNVTEAVSAFDLLCDPTSRDTVAAAGAVRIRERLRPDDPWPTIEKAYG